MHQDVKLLLTIKAGCNQNTDLKFLIWLHKEHDFLINRIKCYKHDDRLWCIPSVNQNQNYDWRISNKRP